jgi:hypothetical protein
LQFVSSSAKAAPVSPISWIKASLPADFRVDDGLSQVAQQPQGSHALLQVRAIFTLSRHAGCSHRLQP